MSAGTVAMTDLQAKASHASPQDKLAYERDLLLLAGSQLLVAIDTARAVPHKTQLDRVQAARENLRAAIANVRGATLNSVINHEAGDRHLYTIRFAIGGGHVHCSLFCAPGRTLTKAKCGDFCVRRGAEFQDLLLGFPGAEFVGTTADDTIEEAGRA